MTGTDDQEKALKALTTATTTYRHTEAAHEQARAEAIAAVVAALAAGVNPTRVADTSPFTAAYVRKIARENDIAPAKPGVKKRAQSGLKVVMPRPKPPTMRAK